MPPTNPPRNPPSSPGSRPPDPPDPSDAGVPPRSASIRTPREGGARVVGNRKAPPLSRILLALDGSAVASAAIPPAVSLAESARGDLYLLRVVKPGMKGGEHDVGDEKSREATEAHQYLADMEKEWFTPSVRFHRVVRVGDPVGEILGVAADVKADVIVMASHGRSGLTKLIVGSVTQGVLNKAAAPVMVIRGK